MMRAFKGLGALWLAAFAATAFAQARELPDFTRLVQGQGPARAKHKTTPAAGPRPEGLSLGSGFIIGSDGYILTNAHVVEGADEINVRFTDKREFKAKVIGSDRRTDIALIKIETSGLTAVKFGDPSRLKVGEWVVAIGAPFGFRNTATAGTVRAT